MNRVSVITVTYNCKEKLEGTITSILSQTYRNSEFIVVDGNSTDGTLQVIDRYRSHISKFLSEPDNGIYDAMNKAIDLASGDWIIFMNAGDEFASNDVLERIFTDDCSEYAVIYGRTNWKLPNNAVKIGSKPIPFFEKTGIDCTMGFCHQSVLVSLVFLGKTRFDLSYKIAADYNMLNTIYNNGGIFKYVDFPISLIEKTDGLSANNRRLQRDESAKIAGIYNSISYQIWTRYRGFVENVKKVIHRY